MPVESGLENVSQNLRLKVRPDPTGRESFSISALSRTGRILGVVHVDVPLEIGYTLAARVGQSGADAILAAAKELARLVAAAVETRPDNDPTVID
jgi:hypothetical protein